MAMASQVHVIDLLPAYALGCLEEAEAARAAEHTAQCAACRAELQPYLAVADRLALAAPDALPPARVKKELMRRIERPTAAPSAEPRPGWWQQMAGLFRRPAPAWALASLVLIVALAAANIWLWQRLARTEGNNTDGQIRVVAMLPTGAAPQAAGKLLISMDGEYGTLVVDGLPPLDPSRQYQLWLIRDGQPTSGGVLTVNAHGYGAFEILAPEPLAHYRSFGVTIEPAGGSIGPTGEKVLGADL
jgi:anti-sigma-K factor RskA